MGSEQQPTWKGSSGSVKNGGPSTGTDENYLPPAPPKYFQRQGYLSLHCGLCSVNNILGRQAYTSSQMDSIARQLSQLDNNSHNTFVLGNYDVNVIISALQQNGFNVNWADIREEKPAWWWNDNPANELAQSAEVSKQTGSRIGDNKQRLIAPPSKFVGFIMNTPTSSNFVVKSLFGNRHWIGMPYDSINHILWVLDSNLSSSQQPNYIKGDRLPTLLRDIKTRQGQLLAVYRK